MTISIILKVMLTEKRFYKPLIIIYLLLLGMIGSVPPVNAQDNPTLAVDPDRVSVPLGNQVQLILEVSDGLDVNAFDILINYDTQRLSLNSWEHGDYLSNIACTFLVNQPGSLELACNQAGQETVDGDGVLLILIFDTLSIGIHEVAITEAAFFDSEAVITYPDRQNGLVEVTSDPTYTPTPTNTFTPTLTLTTTFSLSPSSTSTITTTYTPTITPSLSPTLGTVTPEVTAMTATATASPQEMTPTVVTTPTITETPHPDGLMETDTIPIDRTLETATATETPQEGTDIVEPEPENGVSSYTQSLLRGMWTIVLWGVLIVAVGTLLGVIVGLIKRHKQKGENEDLLL